MDLLVESGYHKTVHNFEIHATSILLVTDPVTVLPTITSNIRLLFISLKIIANKTVYIYI